MVKKKTLRWSERTMYKFLELYRQHACLWNTQLEDHGFQEARTAAMLSIIKRLKIPGLTVPDLRCKIKTIRTMYRKEYSLIQKSLQNGEEPYEPTLFWYKKADSFLNAVAVLKDSPATLDHAQLIKAINDSIKDDSSHQETCDFSESSTASATSEEDTDGELPSVADRATVSLSNAKVAKMRFVLPGPHSQNTKDINNSTMNDATIESLQGPLVTYVGANQADDEFEIFAQYIAVQLKQMPIYNALTCQESIQALINKKRLKVLKHSSSVPFSGGIE